MRRISNQKTVADYLLDRRTRSGILEPEAINMFGRRERVVFADGFAGEINQGIPGESDSGNTGNVGQERENLEDEKHGKPKKKHKPSPAHDG